MLTSKLNFCNKLLIPNIRKLCQRVAKRERKLHPLKETNKIQIKGHKRCKINQLKFRITRSVNCKNKIIAMFRFSQILCYEKEKKSKFQTFPVKKLVFSWQ